MEYIKGGSKAWINITGKTYNYLTVLGYIGKGKWECKCKCGTVCIKRTGKITTGYTKSCGCISKDNATTHGQSKSREYTIWSNIKARCYNKNNTSYERYGKKGIKMTKSWYFSFETFISDMGKAPKGYSIERIDNSKGYSKSNCKWASSYEQALNRRSNLIITYRNENKPLKQWCDELHLNYKTIFARIVVLKWSVDKAFNTKYV